MAGHELRELNEELRNVLTEEFVEEYLTNTSAYTRSGRVDDHSRPSWLSSPSADDRPARPPQPGISVNKMSLGLGSVHAYVAVLCSI